MIKAIVFYYDGYIQVYNIVFRTLFLERWLLTLAYYSPSATPSRLGSAPPTRLPPSLTIVAIPLVLEETSTV